MRSGSVDPSPAISSIATTAAGWRWRAGTSIAGRATCQEWRSLIPTAPVPDDHTISTACRILRTSNRSELGYHITQGSREVVSEAAAAAVAVAVAVAASSSVFQRGAAIEYKTQLQL